MGKLYCIIGKSSSGKDSLFRRLLNQKELSLKTIVPYTTRPMREREREGVEYHFCKEEQAAELERQGKIIELRAYHTIHGIWKYFTVDDGQIDLERANYLMIGTLESFLKIREYYGKESVVPIYIEVDDGERLERALKREREQTIPRYGELCRRFLADASDFSEEKLQEAEITKRFFNSSLEQTEKEVIRYIQQVECGKS